MTECYVLDVTWLAYGISLSITLSRTLHVGKLPKIKKHGNKKCRYSQLHLIYYDFKKKRTICQSRWWIKGIQLCLVRNHKSQHRSNKTNSTQTCNCDASTCTDVNTNSLFIFLLKPSANSTNCLKTTQLYDWPWFGKRENAPLA